MDHQNSIDISDIIKKVDELPNNLRFVNNYHSVRCIKDSFKETEKYDSFFININDNQLQEIWGMYGKNPDANNYVYRIILHRNTR